MGGIGDVYRIMVRKMKGRDLLEIVCVVGRIMYINRNVGCGLDLSSQDGHQRRALVHTLMHLWFP
jgi:hypothetical protein